MHMMTTSTSATDPSLKTAVLSSNLSTSGLSLACTRHLNLSSSLIGWLIRSSSLIGGLIRRGFLSIIAWFADRLIVTLYISLTYCLKNIEFDSQHNI